VYSREFTRDERSRKIIAPEAGETTSSITLVHQNLRQSLQHSVLKHGRLKVYPHGVHVARQAWRARRTGAYLYGLLVMWSLGFAVWGIDALRGIEGSFVDRK